MPDTPRNTRGAIATGTLAGVLGICLAGCAAHIPAPRAPAMPTIAPATTIPAAPATEKEMVDAALRLVSANDIPTAIRSLDRIGAPDVRTRVVVSLIGSLAETNPALAASVAATLPSEPDQTVAVEIAARAWARRDADAALRWALSVSDSRAAHAVRRAVTAELIHADPRTALARIAALPAGLARDDTLGIAAALWATRDADGAVAWLRELPNAALRQQVTLHVAFAIAQTNPERALVLVETLPPGRDRWLVVSAIAQTWVAVNPKAAQTWATNLPAGLEREAAFAGLQSGFGESLRRPNIFPVDSYRPAPLGAASDPIFGAWLANQPRTMSREEAILEFIRQRGSLDPLGVGMWVSGLSDWTTRQRAMEVFLDESLRTSPARAADWLRSLSAAERTDEMIEKTARQWLQLDPRAAEAWLRETNLPSFRQEELLRQAPR
jgi:hypothetical protein